MRSLGTIASLMLPAIRTDGGGLTSVERRAMLFTGHPLGVRCLRESRNSTEATYKPNWRKVKNDRARSKHRSKNNFRLGF